MTEGRKVLGSLDVGLRLRHDCPNITTAFEWAADHDNWIIAGELLTTSWSAYYLDVRFSELNTALRRTAAYVAEPDPDLHGCITVQRFALSLHLTDYAFAFTVADELTRSPLNNFRAIGWAIIAWLSAFGAPENVDGLLAKSGNELNQQTESDTRLSDAHAFAEIWALLAQSAVALFSDDFERSRHLSRELVRRARFADASISVVTAAISEVLLGQPKAALVTVAQLDEFDLPFVDGTEVRGLAHLALGDIETATTFIRRHATRASLGFLRAESNDTMMLLAGLAHQQGDDPAARHFLLDAFTGRQPGTIAYGRLLARQLGIFDAYMSQPDDPDDPQGATRSLHALRAELARRGWD